MDSLTDVPKGEMNYHFCIKVTFFEAQNTRAMTNKSIFALVVSGIGPLQDGLLALMTTIPQISAMLVAEEANSALRMVENHQPSLIILDMSLPKMQEVITEIKTQWPQIHLIVVVENTAQQNEVEGSGVDNVLLKGFPAAKLVALIEDLLSQGESDSSRAKSRAQ